MKKISFGKKMNCALAAAILSSAGGIVWAAPVTTDVPLGSSYYEYIEKLDAMGYVSSMLPGTKPYSRMDMAKWVLEAEQAAQQKEMPSYLKQEMDELERALAPELTYLRGEGRYTSPVRLQEAQAGLTYFHSDAKDYAYRKGINAQWQALNHENNGYRWGRDGNFTSQALIAGNINDRWAVSLTPRFSYDKDQHGGASLEEAYVRSRIGIVHVTAGKEALSWGEGMTGNLALGNNMKPLTMVRFDTGDNIKNKWMRFIFGNSHIFYARLDGNRADTAASQGLTDYNHPGLLGMRSDFQPWRNVTIGLARISLLGGHGNGLDSGDWSDWAVGTNHNADTDRWDDIAGGDFRIRFPGAQIYGEVYGEDQAGFLPSKLAERLGVLLPRLTSDGSWDAALEYAHTTDAWYSHQRFQNGWVYDGNLMGDWMGKNTNRYYGRIRHYMENGQTLSFQLQYTEMDRDLSYAPKAAEAWITWNRKLRDQMSLTVSAGAARVKNASYVSGNKDTIWLGSVLLKKSW